MKQKKRKVNGTTEDDATSDVVIADSAKNLQGTDTDKDEAPKSAKKKRKKKKKVELVDHDPNDFQGVEGLGTRVKNAKLQTLRSGVGIRDTQIGAGSAVKSGAQVNILYEGTLTDGSTFDKRQNRRSPLSFRVGLREVVPGMDIGLEGMRVGGIREMHIPAAMGYGKKQTGPIPANSDLKFEVELLSIGRRRPTSS